MTVRKPHAPQSQCRDKMTVGLVTSRCHAFAGHTGMHYHFEDENEVPWFWKQAKTAAPVP